MNHPHTFTLSFALGDILCALRWVGLAYIAIIGDSSESFGLNYRRTMLTARNQGEQLALSRSGLVRGSMSAIDFW